MKKRNEIKHNNIEKNDLKPFIASRSLEVITPEEIEKRKRRIARAEAIGLNIMHVTSEQNYEDEYENPYKVEALRYILNDMDVPEEVIQKIKEFDEMNVVKRYLYTNH